MEPIIIVEILEKSGKVHERSKLAHFPATFGRAYDNDLILNDPFVSPQHARISLDENGALTLIDLGTENGTHCLPQMQPVSSIALGADTLLRMGQTLVRLRRPDYAVAPTRIDKFPDRLRAAVADSEHQPSIPPWIHVEAADVDETLELPLALERAGPCGRPARRWRGRASP